MQFPQHKHLEMFVLSPDNFELSCRPGQTPITDDTAGVFMLPLTVYKYKHDS